ncbi:MAG: HAMP domain-containing sensor histidine kinase [Planctomycetota bacterium]
MNDQPKFLKRLISADVGIFGLALLFITLMHGIALEDRVVLILCYLVAVGAAYALMRRQALGLAAAFAAIMAALIFAKLYFEALPPNWHPVFDAPRDMVGLAALIYLALRLLILSYRMQRDERRRALREKVEAKRFEMRAEALRRTSDEFRTPLSTITAISETLLDGSTGDLTEDQREFIGDIDEAAQHLLALVNGILDYANAEAGLIRLQPQPVALAELVDQCFTMVSARAQEAGVSLTAQVDLELQEVEADPLRLRQMLLNLLSNAIKYNSEGGTVIVRIRSHDDHTYHIIVRDTGRGIDPKHLQYLFDPYYQAALTGQDIGTGLGLATMKHLTQLHGGKVEVDSVVGTGTMFTIHLPKSPNVVDQELEANDQEAASQNEFSLEHMSSLDAPSPDELNV